MPRSLTSISRFHSLLVFLLLLADILSPAPAASDPPNQNVLIVHSYHQGFRWTDSIMEGMLQIFAKELAQPNIHIEYLDAKRLPPEKSLPLFGDLLRLKYGKNPPKVILTSDDAAFQVMLGLRSSLFPTVPLVFCGVNDLRDSMLAGQEQITGVVEDFDLAGTLDIALRLHPQTRNIAVVSDSTETGRINLARFHQIKSAYAARAQIIELTDLSEAELRQGLAQLPENSIILHLSFYRDRLGKIFTVQEMLDCVAESTAQPVYVAWDFVMGNKALGGLVVSGEQQGEKAAEMAAQILRGKPAANLQIQRTSPNTYIFDYNEMRRFAISEANLPADTQIINKPTSALRMYRWWIIGSLSLLVLQGLLILALFTNSRQHKRAKNELGISEERFRIAFDADAIGRTLTRIDGTLLRVNDRFCQMLGYSQADMASLSFADITHPDDLQISRAAVTSLLTGQENMCQFEKRYLRRDGSPIWTEMTTTLVRDEQGQPQHFITGVLDISQRKLAEEALQESEANYKFVVANMEESLSVITADGTFLFANHKAARNLCGGQPEEMVGRKISDFISPDQSQDLIATYRRTIESGQRMAQIVPIIVMGKQHWFLNTQQPLRYGRNQCEAILSMSLDITEQKQIEAEKERLQSQLQQAQKMEAIGTLAGGIAHDFNNILGAILGYSEIAREDTPIDSPAVAALDQVILAGTRAKDLVKQILAFSRQAETKHIHIQPATIVKETIKLLRSSLPSTITIDQDLAADCGLILADPTQIHQILMNLATNAYHAMEEHGGILTISLRRKALTEQDTINAGQARPGEYVQLTVGDSGAGIKAAIVDRIFEPYFTTKEQGKGTGMGLAIVHGIVTSFDGYITCHSELGKGTSFDVFLPTSTSDPTIESSTIETLAIGNERILFVDDETVLAEMAKTMLERLGYTVTLTNSSFEALATFQNQPDQFDLVITDQTMPGMTGIELAQSMLQIRPDLPIILCTGFSNQVSKEKAQALGIREFALKPLTRRDIAGLIRKVLTETYV